MRGLGGKVLIVAGGGSGIGAATSLRLAQEGASVVVGDLDAAHATATARAIADAGGTARGAQFDITDETSVRALVATAVDAFGGLDGMPMMNSTPDQSRSRSRRRSRLRVSRF